MIVTIIYDIISGFDRSSSRGAVTAKQIVPIEAMNFTVQTVTETSSDVTTAPASVSSVVLSRDADIILHLLTTSNVLGRRKIVSPKNSKIFSCSYEL